MRPPMVAAVAQRKLTSLRRDRRTLVFVLLLPMLQIVLFGIAIGGEPIDLPFAVVNHDAGDEMLGQPVNLGAAVTTELRASETVAVHEYATMDEAIAAVEAGEAWGVLYLPQNLTTALLTLARENATTEELVAAQALKVELRLDNSNQQIALALARTVQQAFADVSGTRTPLDTTQPIYGESEPAFIDFLAPGIITLVCFVFSMMLTTMSFVNERYDGTLDRVFAAGVRPAEVVLGHLLAMSTLLVGQVVVLLAVAFWGFAIPLEGSLALVFALGLLMGLGAMALGLLISSRARSEFQAMQLAIPVFFPVLLISGVLWPVQAIPGWLRWVSWLLPTTWAAEAFRSIMIRGWGIAEVWPAFAVNAAWTALFLTLAVRSLRTRE